MGSGLSRACSSQTEWVKMRGRSCAAAESGETFLKKLIVSVQENDHKRRLLVAGFDWPPGQSPGRNPGPLCDSSVSVFVPRSSNYAQLHVFIWERIGGKEGGGGTGGGGGV